MESLQILAGTISSCIFMLRTLSMLIKAWRTRDVRSYSLAQIGLYNVGNVVHWLYVISLPFGPIWFLHGFFTLSSAVMLIWCILYRFAPALTEKRTTETLKRVTATARRISQPAEFPRVQIDEGDALSRKDTR